MTAVFISVHGGGSQARPWSWSLPFHDIDAEILDYGVGQQLPAHGLDLGFGLGGVGFGQLKLDELALADVGDAAEAERLKRVLDGLALRVEDALLEGDVDLGFLILFLVLVNGPRPSRRCKSAASG